MRLTEALSRLRSLNQQAIRTADAMALFNAEKSSASKILARLEKSGHMVRIKRGLWAFTEGLVPLALVEPLTAPLPSCISLQSALYHHGMISQIPRVTYCVSLARSRVYNTPAGTFSVHHIAAGFFTGYEAIGERYIKMATPEKALLDFLYLGPSRSRLFAALPELELPSGFSVRRARGFMKLIASPRRRSMVSKRLEALLEAV